MKWNYKSNRPSGSYRELTTTPDSFRKDVEEWIEVELANSTYDANELQVIKNTLENVGYDLHEYMLAHAYNTISDVKLREYFVLYMCLGNSPAMKLFPYNTEEYKTMGDIDILTRAKDLKWGGQKNVSDFDIYCRYYFCASEDEILDIYCDGAGDLRKLITFYEDNDRDKALRALLYIYGIDNDYLNIYTGKYHQTRPQSVKEEVVSILKSDFLDGMDDDFFNRDNIFQACFAWNLNVIEIRQEFVRNEQSIEMLKMVLNQTGFIHTNTEYKTFKKWIKWAKQPSERRKGYNNILPAITEFLETYPEYFSDSETYLITNDNCSVCSVDHVAWEKLSETIIVQCFNNTFGPRYSRVSNIPSDELVRLSTDIVGSEIAESFAAWNDFTIRQDDEEASILPSQIGRTAIK